MPKLTPTFNDTKDMPPPPIINGGTPHVWYGAPIAVPGAEPTVPNLPPVQAAEPAPVVKPEPLKIALIGTAPSSRMLAPFHDTSWKIWGCSPGNMNVLPRVDVWFELHGNLHWPENRSYGEPYVKYLNELVEKIPVYMQDQVYVPKATTFPKDEMVRLFGRDFFTSSFAWMMALAISQGASEIALFGIDMASKDEYILQRPGFYFFKHLAERSGIKVWAPNESDIMQPPGLYGYSEVTPFGRKILAREKELKSRIDGMRAELNKLQNNITYLEGAVEDIDYIKSIWIGQG